MNQINRFVADRECFRYLNTVISIDDDDDHILVFVYTYASNNLNLESYAASTIDQSYADL